MLEYDFIKNIGFSGTSEVYQIKSNKSQKYFACKVIDREQLKNRAIPCGLEREIRLQELLIHPNIVKLWKIVY